MSKYPQTFDSALLKLQIDMKKAELSPATVRSYTGNITAAFKIIWEENPQALPHNITLNDLEYLRTEMREEGFTISTQKDYLSGIRKITEFYDNYTLSKVKIRWQQDMRPTVDWLNYDQAKQLMDLPKSPIQDLIVHTGLCLGFRRTEKASMMVKHIHANHIDIIGKGQMGGKLRSVPFHPQTQEVIDRFLDYRKSVINIAQSKHRTPIEIPDKMLIYERGGELKPYDNKKHTAINEKLNELNKELGFHFSHHTLRRTFGRLMHQSGASVETIAKLLGHENTTTTLLYLGIDLDEMMSAMSRFILRR